MRHLTVGLALTLGLAGPALAIDPWEGGGDDDGNFSHNTLGHGSVQTHDMEMINGVPDQDWIIVPTLLGHSYEARISDTNVPFDFGACGICAQFERVDTAGTILQDDAAVVNEGSGGTEESYDRTLRWIATVDTTDQYVRVRGLHAMTASDVYTLRYWDTTLAAPRWNNASGQVTVFLLSNMTQQTVIASISFYNAVGIQLAYLSTNIPRNGLYVVPTSSLSALAGQSGHAVVAHTAGYGGIAGKAVALEPATGFSFDTPFQSMPN